MSALTLVPSEYTPGTTGVRELVAEIENARTDGRRVFEVEKFVGRDRDGRPGFPKVLLRAATGPFGPPVASVSIYRTRSACDASTGSLVDLDVRVACEYYLKLDSVEALDAVEKVMHAPTPKAIALIALLGQLKPEQPELVQKPQQEAIDV